MDIGPFSKKRPSMLDAPGLVSDSGQEEDSGACNSVVPSLQPDGPRNVILGSWGGSQRTVRVLEAPEEQRVIRVSRASHTDVAGIIGSEFEIDAGKWCCHLEIWWMS